MKATELRHGNLVEYNGIMWVVLSITYPSPRNDNYSDKWLLELSNGGIITVTLDECNPIPLTYEWLERFGWVKSKDRSYFWHDSNFTLWFNDNGLFIESVGGKLYIKQVHQLQNLYFALTGEELQTDETDQKVNL